MRTPKIMLIVLIFLAFGQGHAVFAASAAGNQPTSLYIPKISQTVPIIPVGVTPGDAIDVPHNFVQAGWYEYGATPGQVGSAIIDGHVDNGGATPGVFKHLKDLGLGDDIYVTQTSGRTLHFKVTATTIYGMASSSAPILANTGSPLLQIITCYGTFMPKQRTYDRRLVVTASLVG